MYLEVEFSSAVAVFDPFIPLLRKEKQKKQLCIYNLTSVGGALVISGHLSDINRGQ